MSQILSSIIFIIVAGNCVAVAFASDDARANKRGDGEHAFRATVSGDSEVKLAVEKDRLIIDVSSSRGIDRAKIERTGESWPKSIVLRMHLKGLESLKVTAGELTVAFWVASSGDKTSYAALHKDGKETSLDKTSPFFALVRTVGGNGKIPLEGGYFEIVLPVKLLEQNPKSLSLAWVDFFRG